MTDTEVSSTSEDAGDDPEDEPTGPSGPLDGDAARRVAGAQVAIIATSDAHGERDVAVLAGPRCFVRVLDAHRLAYPDEGLEPMTASRSNIAEAPGIAMLLVEPGDDGAGGRRALHLNGTARAVPADELSTQYGDLPADPVPGQSTDVWVVVDVGDAYALDGAEVPPLGGGGARVVPAGRGGGRYGGRSGRYGNGRGGGRGDAAAASTSASTSGGTSGGRRRSPLVLVLSILVLALVVALIGSVAVLTNRSSTASDDASSASPAPPPAAAGSAGLPPGPPTLFGRVTQVVNVNRIVVDVGGTPVTVDVLGLDARGVPPCATGDATAFARTKLQGQEVTLVPDPTIPPQASPPGVARAYPVLGTQEGYTDSVLRAGWGSAGGPSRYLSGYRTEQSTAEDAGVGMFGPPCVRGG